jgi:hypothetical protein
MARTRSPSPPASSSSSSSATVAPAAAPRQIRDPESQKFRNERGYFAAVLDQTGVTDDVAAYPYHGEGTAAAPFVVDFLPGGDAHHAMRFPRWKKWTITVIQAIATLAVTFVSSGYVGGMVEIIREFDVSTTVAILVSLQIGRSVGLGASLVLTRALEIGYIPFRPRIRHWSSTMGTHV